MDARKLVFPTTNLTLHSPTLHFIGLWTKNPFWQGVHRSLKHGGRLLFQMAGKGNAKDILSIIDEFAVLEPWKKYFSNMTFPYGFFDPEEYGMFLCQAGLMPVRVELFPRDMKHQGREGLAGWVRTTWLPFTDRLPVELRPRFVDLIVNRYLELASSRQCRCGPCCYDAA